MGAGFLIINRAIKSAAEKKREEEKREAKLKADGYVREFVLMNPDTCYKHYYRNMRKQQTGVLFSGISFLVLSVIIATMIIFQAHIIMTIICSVASVFLLIGLKDFFNVEHSWTGSKEYLEREGCVWFRTEHEPFYDFKWIKEEEK